MCERNKAKLKVGVNVSMEEEFVLQDEGVATEMVNGIPSITFFDCVHPTTFLDRVHRFTERKMARSVVIKLLGRTIGFNTLLNKVSLLWNIRGRVQLMDLENDFYLVRFGSKIRMILTMFYWVVVHVLSLDIKPISRQPNREVDTQVVWIRLPGLSRCFYFDFLLRALGRIIEPVIHIDACIDATVKGRVC